MSGEADIIGRLDSILAAEKAPPAQQPPPQEPAAHVQAEAPPAEEPQGEEPPAPNKQVEGEEPPPEERQAAEIPLDELEAIELEVPLKGSDGKESAEKRTIKELRDGYLRQQDYSRKTQELATQREQLQTETRKAVEAERINYVKELQTLSEMVDEVAATELQGVNWAQLSQTDPFEYVRLDNRRKQFESAKVTIKSKQQELIAKHESERKAALREQAGKARAQLEAEIPGWNDNLYQSLLKTGVEKFGFRGDEVASWVDPRLIKLLHAAQEGTKSKEQTKVETPAPAKRVVVPPRALKPGAQTQGAQGQQRHMDAMKRLQGSGKIDDAAAVIRARLGG